LTHCKRCSGEEEDNYVTDSQCETIRSQLLTMQDTTLLASKHGIHQKVLCDHASGRCTCDASNPLEYSHSLRKWVEQWYTNHKARQYTSRADRDARHASTIQRWSVIHCRTTRRVWL